MLILCINDNSLVISEKALILCRKDFGKGVYNSLRVIKFSLPAPGSSFVGTIACINDNTVVISEIALLPCINDG